MRPSTRRESYQEVVDHVRRSIAPSVSGTRPMRGSIVSRVSVVSSGLAHAIGVVRNQRSKLIEGKDGDGALGTVSWRVFAAGVVNTLATAYVLGAYPEHYWVYYMVQAVVLLAVRLVSWQKAQLHLYLLDFCWLTNFVIAALAVVCFLAQVFDLEQLSPSAETARKLFLLFFTVVEGPLAMAVGVTGNSLVFHSFELTAALFIHASPMLVGWTFRWHRERVEAAYPGLLGSAVGDVNPWEELVLPAIGYYFVWWVPYTLWLLIDGLSRPERGFDTVFENFRPLVMGQLRLTDVRKAAIVYMVAHAIGTNLSWIISLGCFYSFYFHTFIVCSMIFLAIKAGASMYEYLILDAYDDVLRKELEVRGPARSILM